MIVYSLDIAVQIGDIWCRMVTRKRKRKKNRRFTVSLSEQDYKRLQKIASSHRPPFTLQYIVNWGIQNLLDRAEDPQLRLGLGDPLSRNSA